ncbi:MAG TPA: hypothetical protein VIP11_14800, partial [Gemmatimonadaceae bacterium]
WNGVREESGAPASPDSLPLAMLGWILGCAFVYAALFGTGSLLYGNMPQFFTWLAVAAVSAVGVMRVLRGFWRTER